jgi:TRAP-type C4-dicarboxylate transport system permease large subunit
MPLPPGQLGKADVNVPDDGAGGDVAEAEPVAHRPFASADEARDLGESAVHLAPLTRHPFLAPAVGRPVLAASKLFSQLLAFTGATGGLVALVAGLELQPWQMFMLLMAVPLVLCMFIDQIAFMLLAIPLYVPIVGVYGFDPIWFWTMFLIILTIGSITPPFGYTLFAIKGSSDALSMNDVFRASVPVLFIFLSGVAILCAFPAIVTWLPRSI